MAREVCSGTCRRQVKKLWLVERDADSAAALVHLSPQHVGKVTYAARTGLVIWKVACRVVTIGTYSHFACGQ